MSIVTKTVKIKVWVSLEYYKSLGYICNSRDGIIEIDINDLSKGSHVNIVGECDICGTHRTMMYKTYIRFNKKHNFYSCHGYQVEKAKLTNMERYGVEHLSQSIETQIRNKKTRIENGTQIPDDMVDDFVLYRRKVDNITDFKFRKIFIESWDGYDYYDGEYIKDNFSLSSNDRTYPTIDHKISVYYGFLNDIDPVVIGDISNLCVTKNGINAGKRHLNDDEFKKKMGYT